MARIYLILLPFLYYNVFAQNISGDNPRIVNLENVQELLNLSNNYSLKYDFDSALLYARKANFIASHHTSLKESVTTLKNLADIYFMKGDYANAGKHYTLILPLCKKAGLELEENKTYLNLANVEYLEGKLIMALVNCKKALKYFTKVNDIRGQSHCFTNLGNIYGTLGIDNKLVLDNYLKAYELCVKLGDGQRKVGALCNIGTAYTNLKQYDKALHYFDLALEDSKELRDTLLISTIYSNKGNLLAFQGNFDNSIIEFKKAEEFGIAAKNNYKLSNVLMSICNTLFDKNDLEGALKYGLKSLKMAEETNNKECENSVLYTLSIIEEKLGHISSSLTFLKRHYQLNNTNFGKETVRKVEQAEARIKYENALELNKLNQKKIKEAYKYETTIRKMELRKTQLVGTIIIILLLLSAAYIVLYTRQKKLRAEQENAKLEQKIFRAQMNPHFLFNSLNSIQRMFMEGKVEAANDAVADFSNLLRRILNNSGHMYISLKEELETLKLYMDIEKIRCDNAFDYQLSIGDDIDVNNFKVPPLIIQPFIENAIWHGILPSKKKGMIIINFNLSPNGNELDCIIQDNGVGIDLNKLNNANSKGIVITEQRLGSKPYFLKMEKGGTLVKFKIQLQK